MQKLYFRTLLSLFVLFVAIFSSCKKDSASSSDKLTGKWTVLYVNTHVVSNGQSATVIDTLKNTYIQFNSDNSLVASQNNQTSAGTWKLSGNTLIMVDASQSTSDTVNINKLTSTELQLYSKQTDGNNFSEQTTFLHK